MNSHFDPAIPESALISLAYQRRNRRVPQPLAMTNGTAYRLISRPPAVVAIESLLSVLFLVSVVVGNLLVCLAVFRNHRLRKSSSVYIVCLAVTDLSTGVLVFPINVITLATGNFPGRTASCWFQAITSFYFVKVSILTMAMIAVQRYLKVVKPNKHREIFTFRFFVWSIAFICSLAAVSVTILAVTANGVHFYEGFPVCMMNMDRITIVVAVDTLGVLSPLLLISLSYFSIWRFIKNHNSQMNYSNVKAEEVKLTKSLFIVVGMFAACYTPFTIAISLIVLHQVDIPRVIQVTTLSGVALASVVNPIIYAAMNREFRTEFARIVCWPLATRVISVMPEVSQRISRRPVRSKISCEATDNQ